MTAITETVREQAFLPFECDVPDGQTLREWRGRRRRTPRASVLTRKFGVSFPSGWGWRQARPDAGKVRAN